MVRKVYRVVVVNVSPGPGLWSLVLGPFGPDLGLDLVLTWDLDLDLSLTFWKIFGVIFERMTPKNVGFLLSFFPRLII